MSQRELRVLEILNEKTRVFFGFKHPNACFDWVMRQRGNATIKGFKNLDLLQSKALVKNAIAEVLGDTFEISDQMPLIGSQAQLDSIRLVSLCLTLEDLSEQFGFEFDWTSENAMSKSKGMFKDVSTLSKEFARQSEL